jgi:hypothetical protein
MHRALLILLVVALAFSGCSKSPTSSAASGNASDPMEKKLMEVAGNGATSCGHLKAQSTPELEAASKCAMQAAQQKHAFYVAYEMPGMTVAVVGTAEGKLFSLQSQPSAPGGLSNVPCPNELRVAPSGRVTCYAPGTFPMSAGSDSHTGMTTMPPMQNPHQTPPADKPNQQQQKPPGHP